jgi:hypothetical protein
MSLYGGFLGWFVFPIDYGNNPLNGVPGCAGLCAAASVQPEMSTQRERLLPECPFKTKPAWWVDTF